MQKLTVDLFLALGFIALTLYSAWLASNLSRVEADFKDAQASSDAWRQSYRAISRDYYATERELIEARKKLEKLKPFWSRWKSFKER